jgi:gamma-glutamyl-gamma-aminobutyrate hydrolase PuuD
VPHPQTVNTRPDRDRGELTLLEAALARDMPVLAVCRGSQVLNVARGGDLVQHLPEVVGDDKHKHTPGVFADHAVRIEPGSRLGALVGEHAPVKSHHHQGFGRVGDGLREVAWAEDGTPEALEDPEKRFAVGVLWHPEAGEDFALFEALVHEAGVYREQKAAARA